MLFAGSHLWDRRTPVRQLWRQKRSGRSTERQSQQHRGWYSYLSWKNYSERFINEYKNRTMVRRSWDGSYVWNGVLGSFHSAWLICFRNAVLKQTQIYLRPNKFS